MPGTLELIYTTNPTVRHAKVQRKEACTTLIEIESDDRETWTKYYDARALKATITWNQMTDATILFAGTHPQLPSQAPLCEWIIRVDNCTKSMIIWDKLYVWNKLTYTKWALRGVLGNDIGSLTFDKDCEIELIFNWAEREIILSHHADLYMAFVIGASIILKEAEKEIEVDTRDKNEVDTRDEFDFDW